MRCRSIPTEGSLVSVRFPNSICRETYPVGNLTRHRRDHHNAAWGLLLHEDARTVLGGNECSKDTK